jgi:cephalosporin hydroxylase
MERNVYGTNIPGDSTFRLKRRDDIRAMGQDEALRSAALELQLRAESYSFGYQQEWCGVPVIRLPDDIVTLQEIVWQLRPRFVVETGVARGGSLVLSASLMAIAQLEPRVLGLDIRIMDHARTAIMQSPFASSIDLWEGDSAGVAAQAAVESFVTDTPGAGPGLLVLDSDHSHDHVLQELRTHAILLPVGSLVLVADTLIEEFPAGHYPDRPWDKGNNPFTAVHAFLAERGEFRLSESWVRRGLLTEFRDGIIERFQ